MLRTHRNGFFCSLLFVAPLLFCQQSFAWNYKEHYQLGKEAFRSACDNLMEEYDDALANPALGNSMGRRNTEKYNELKQERALLGNIPCHDIGGRSDAYGLRSSLSGDHVSDPKDFESIEAESQALSWTVYGKLALNNFSHFAPYSKQEWRSNHIEAIQLAVLAREIFDRANYSEAIETFNRALVYSSFGDHFLQDTFAIGHSGFSRVHSLQNPSQTFHDHWNEYGRAFAGVKLSKGELFIRENLLEEEGRELAKIKESVWLKKRNLSIRQEMDSPETDKVTAESYVYWNACGDGNLNSGSDDLCDNRTNHLRLHRTNTRSVTAVILAFVKGEDLAYSKLVEEGFPLRSQAFRPNKTKPRSIMLSEESYQKSSEYEATGDEKLLSQSNFDDNKYWMPMDIIHEKVYSALSIMGSYSASLENDDQYGGLHLAYGLAAIKSNLPASANLYVHLSFRKLDEVMSGDNRYHEVGLNLSLPNFYQGTPLSHNLEIAWAQSRNSMEGKATEAGVYLGVNTYLDILKLKIALGVGGFFPHRSIQEVEPQVRLMIGYSFGVTGGGSLKRWL